MSECIILIPKQIFKSIYIVSLALLNINISYADVI